MDKIERQKIHFDNIAEKYFNARQDKKNIYLKNLIWKYFFKCIKSDFVFNKVLEPMCGYAEGKKILELQFGNKFEYTGFDYSQVLVDKVKKQYPDINIFHEDIVKFNNSEKYDLILIIGGLHHIPDYVDKVIKNLKNHLTDKGYFIVFEPTHNNKIFEIIRSKIYRRNILFDSKTERAFKLRELNNYFRKNDFKIIEQIYPGLISYILWYNPDAFPLLNLNSIRLLKMFFNIDKLFFKNFIGKYFSFATLTLYQKDI
jgi:SAM-dependent methyltransferase